jgi:hypothetical protein
VNVIGSPLQPNVRGLHECLEFLDKEDVVPLLIVAVRLDKSGMITYLLDASPIEQAENIRISMLGSVIQAVANKLHMESTTRKGG